MQNKVSFYLQVIEGKRKGFWVMCFKAFLSLLSLLYRGLLFIDQRFQLLRQKKVSVPVISVGNITWGGTGKTPFVLFLLDFLTSQNKKTAVLLRGYGNDEHVLYSKNLSSCQVGIGGKRYDVAQTMLLQEDRPEMFILDDGFQHRRLFRDLDIVLIDSTNPFGNNHIIPRGSLREPKSSLKRADIIVITRCKEHHVFEKLKKKIQNIVEDIDIPIFQAEMYYQGFVEYATGKVCDVQDLYHKKAGLFCGIGNPNAFTSSVKECHIKIEKKYIFLDHYNFTKNDIQEVIADFRTQSLDVLITTEKDIVRIQQLKLESYLKESNITIYYPKLTLNIGEQDDFINRCNRILFA